MPGVNVLMLQRRAALRLAGLRLAYLTWSGIKKWRSWERQ